MEDITGRDRHIITKALAYAIEAIDRLPPERRPVSDQADMRVLLGQIISDVDELALVLKEAREQITGGQSA